MADSAPRGYGGVGPLILVMVAVMGFVTATTMLGPLLVDIARDLGISVGQAGLLATAMSVPWALFAPFTGLLSDRFGRRPMIVIALAGVGVVSLGVAASTSFLLFLGLRFVAGLLGAFGPPSVMAAVGDLAPPEKRGRAMAWLNFGFSLAAIVAVPVVGAIGGAFGWRWAFVAVGALLLLLALLVHRAFPPPAPTRLGLNVFAGYSHVLRVPRLMNVLVANLLERAIFNAAALYLAPFLILGYALSAVEIAPALSLVALGALGGNVLGGWLADRFPKALTFVVAQLLAGVAALALFGAPLGLLASAALGALFGLANSSSRPAFLALGSELSVRDRGAVLGLVSLTNQGGVAVGSAVGGLAIELGGYAGLAWVAALGGAAAALFALPLARPPASRG